MEGELPQLEILLAQVLSHEQDGTIALKAILTALADKAAKGDLKAAEMLLERAYGKTGADSDNTTTKWNGTLVCTDEQFNQLLEAARNGATKGNKGE